MKKEDLYDAIGDIDDQYVEEAHMKNKGKNTFAWAKWGTIAACFALLVLCIPMVTHLLPVVDDNTPTVESSPIENNNKVEALPSNSEEPADLEDLAQEKESESVESTEIEDAPADSNGEYNEAVNSDDLTPNTAEFFGGSYTDDSGKFVIVLTEDTPENRTAICKELGRSENNTTFVSGNYTLAYLTELQEKISNAMANKELPFVVSSGLYETTNNIVVRVTTTDESELAKVYAFDTLGGAIKIEFSSGATIDLLIAPKAE